MARESERPRHRERKHRDRDERRSSGRSPRKSKHDSASSQQSGSQLLSADALAKLDRLNQNNVRSAEVTPKKERRHRPREVIDEKVFVVEKSGRQHKRKKRRVVSGALLEEGDGERLKGLRGGDKYDRNDRYERYEKEEETVQGDRTKKKRLCG
jgi:glucan 1,3-beta-glucosidase